MTRSPPVLHLTQLIGQGNHRQCWQHPLEPHLCIKVLKPDTNSQQNKIEWHYSRYLAWRKVAGPYIALPLHKVPTNLGEGLVFPLIANADGTPAISLPEALESGRLSHEQAATVVNTTFDWLIQHKVLYADYGIDNMLVQQHQDGSRTLVLIDGLGARNYNINYFINLLLPFKAVLKAREFRIKTLSQIADYRAL